MSRTLTAEFTTGTMKQERGSEWNTILADWYKKRLDLLYMEVSRFQDITEKQSVFIMESA